MQVDAAIPSAQTPQPTLADPLTRSIVPIVADPLRRARVFEGICVLVSMKARSDAPTPGAQGSSQRACGGAPGFSQQASCQAAIMPAIATGACEPNRIS